MTDKSWVEKKLDEFDKKFFYDEPAGTLTQRSIARNISQRVIFAFLREAMREAVLKYDSQVFPESSGETISQVWATARQPIYDRRTQALEGLKSEATDGKR